MRSLKRTLTSPTLLLILALTSSSQSIKNYSEIDHTKFDDRSFRQCKNVRVGDKHNGREATCVEPFELYVLNRESTLPTESKEAMLDRLQREREQKVAEGGHYLYRSEIITDSTSLSPLTNESTINWCSIPGWFPDEKAACNLCEAVEDNQKLPRGYITDDGKHMCVCRKWGRAQEQFMACNCDLCDALLVHGGLRAQCRKMYRDCHPQKYLSAYATLENYNAFFKYYNSHHDIAINPDFLVGELLKNQPVCKSGLQGKAYEDHEGTLFDDIPHRDNLLIQHECRDWLIDVGLPHEMMQ